MLSEEIDDWDRLTFVLFLVFPSTVAYIISNYLTSYFHTFKNQFQFMFKCHGYVRKTHILVIYHTIINLI